MDGTKKPPSIRPNIVCLSAAAPGFRQKTNERSCCRGQSQKIQTQIRIGRKEDKRMGGVETFHSLNR